jgi:hypothetical protein
MKRSAFMLSAVIAATMLASEAGAVAHQPNKAEFKQICRAAKPLSDWDRFRLGVAIKIDQITGNSVAENKHFNQQYQDALSGWCGAMRMWLDAENKRIF